MENETQRYVFASAEEALAWSVEVLRRRRLPKISGFWKEIFDEADFVARAWEGSRDALLPTSHMDRIDLALKVEAALDKIADCDTRAARLLKARFWGDWLDEPRLRAAMALQEKLRREGVRVRLAYRYSYAQLALLLGCEKKAVWRDFRKALELLERELMARGLLMGPLERGSEDLRVSGSEEVRG